MLDQPLGGDARHDLIRVVDKPTTAVAKGERQGVGDFVRSSRAERGRGIGHRDIITRLRGTYQELRGTKYRKLSCGSARDRAFPIRMLGCPHIAVFVLVLCVPRLAEADACDQIFAGGQPPVLLNAKLSERTTILCNDAFVVLASGVTRGPLWSAEHLTATGVAQARITARTGTFHDDERLPLDDRAMLSDYVRSGFDRGHMAPSGDKPNQGAQQQSFSLTNIVPQTAVLNRDVWEGIESAVRHLAESRGELYVVTGPIFQGDQVQSLKGRVLVPTTIWKAVYDPTTHGAAAYRCTNVTRPRCVIGSISALTSETGIDPFPAISWLTKHLAMTLPQPEPSRYHKRRR